MIKNRLERLVLDGNVMTETSFGFVKKKSAINCVNYLVSTVKEKLRMGNNVICVFLDMMNAFDFVERIHHLDKLQELLRMQKVPSEYINWINQYHRYRLVHVRIVTGILNKRINDEILQGDVPCPFLFVLYTTSRTRTQSY